MKQFCGMQLVTTGKVVAIIGMVISLLFIGTLPFFLKSIDEFVETSTEMPQSRRNRHLSVWTIESFYFGVNFNNLVASLLLYYASVKKQHLLVLPWLISYSFWFFIVTMFICSSMPNLLMKLSSFISTGIFHILVWRAILSLYRKLRLDDDSAKQEMRMQLAVRKNEFQ